MQAKSIESVWAELWPHLDWADGFSLILLFAGHPGPVRTIRERIADRLKLRTQKLRLLAPETPDAVRGLASEILATTLSRGGPVWIELWREPTHEDWQAARRFLLHRLNERRFLLERDLHAPLILVLPTAERSSFYIDSPDLWTIRSFTAELAPPETRPANPPRAEKPELLGPAGPESPAEREWQRLRARFERRDTFEPDRLNPADGFAAFDAAMDRGALATAQSIAEDVLHLCRSIREQRDGTPEALRNLSIALDNIGRIQHHLGHLAAARDAYRESLAICRQLQQSIGDTPQTQRDRSVSLDRVGDVERDLGDLAAARDAYRESLAIRRQLRQTIGDTPQALRDLSVLLNKVGDVERDLGDPATAGDAYRESFAISRQLRQSIGDMPQALRDLSISLGRVGDVERDLGDLAAARDAYRESLAIRRQLRGSIGDIPQALRDLSVSLDRIGDVERDLGDLTAARDAYRESHDIRERLCAIFPDHPLFRKDLDWSIANWGSLESQGGDPRPSGTD